VKIGMAMGFGNLFEDLTDAQMIQGEIELAVLADELGFDGLWAVEHHFDDYAMCPDNVLLTLGTAAVILPWNDPLRVAEKMIMLDIVSGGRAMFGMGRGLSRSEYAPFRIPMEESRGRFDEAARMIIDALETGWIEGDGPYYPQPRTRLRPDPIGSFRDRLYCVAGSAPSVEVAVELGAAVLIFLLRPVKTDLAPFRAYSERWERTRDTPAPPVLLNAPLFCHRDSEVAHATMREHLTRFFLSNVAHYEYDGHHFAEISGYERYVEIAQRLRDTGLERTAEIYAEASMSGTPAEILGKIEETRDCLGDFDLAVLPGFGGVPYPAAQESLKLFAEEVVPVAKAMVSGSRVSSAA
jgi:alkanesulfonate monooxygenase SsuD/methylene tetrahydromethanopterin reductase-like flavin-dependent oxidoreductase (luciferase family)